MRAPTIVSPSLGISSGPHPPRNWSRVIDDGLEEEGAENVAYGDGNVTIATDQKGNVAKCQCKIFSWSLILQL